MVFLDKLFVMKGVVLFCNNCNVEAGTMQSCINIREIGAYIYIYTYIKVSHVRTLTVNHATELMVPS